jgi:4-hydroxy 2-oxovalerate aldolase
MELLLDLIARHFHPLFDRYRWEPNAFYASAGIRHVHPMFVQRMSDVDAMGTESTLRAMRYLASEGASVFNEEQLDLAWQAGEVLGQARV